MGRGFHILTYPFDSLSFPHFILNVVSLLHRPDLPLTLVSVFHRILDFKTGLNFYSGPFFLYLFQELYRMGYHNKCIRSYNFIDIHLSNNLH